MPLSLIPTWGLRHKTVDDFHINWKDFTEIISEQYFAIGSSEQVAHKYKCAHTHTLWIQIHWFERAHTHMTPPLLLLYREFKEPFAVQLLWNAQNCTNYKSKHKMVMHVKSTESQWNFSNYPEKIIKSKQRTRRRGDRWSERRWRSRRSAKKIRQIAKTTKSFLTTPAPFLLSFSNDGCVLSNNGFQPG